MVALATIAHKPRRGAASTTLFGVGATAAVGTATGADSEATLSARFTDFDFATTGVGAATASGVACAGASWLGHSLSYAINNRAYAHVRVTSHSRVTRGTRIINTLRCARLRTCGTGPLFFVAVGGVDRPENGLDLIAGGRGVENVFLGEPFDGLSLLRRWQIELCSVCFVE